MASGQAGQTARKTTTRSRRRIEKIPASVLEAQRRAAEEAIRANAEREPSLKDHLVAIGHGSRLLEPSNTNLVQKVAASYGDVADGRAVEARYGVVFDGLRLEDLSTIILQRTQEAHSIGRAQGSDETRETWQGIMRRERLETTAALLKQLGDELAPILKGLGAPKGAGDARRREALTALVGFCGELAAAGRAVQEALQR